MRVLVTGSSGFLGSSIAEKLFLAGHEVVGMDIVDPKDRGNFSSFNRIDLAGPDVEKEISEIPRCEAIVHAGACLSKDPNSLNLSTVNCSGTHSLARIGIEWGSKVFVYLSSVPVIGLPFQLPITEEHPINPNTLYHASKLYGEYVVRTITADFRKVILRLTSPVGPGLKKRTIFSVFAENAVKGIPLNVSGKGTRIQNYVDARDVALAIEKSLEASSASGIYNIAGEKSISNVDLAKTCINLLGSSSRIVLGETKDPEEGVIWDVSIRKASRDFGFRPFFEIGKSIEDYLRYENLLN